MLILPHATANLEHDFYLRYPYNYQGLWFLAAQRYGDENGMKYYGAWVLDPNGNMVVYSKNAPGYVYYELAVD